jgi:hypothetical protein
MKSDGVPRTQSNGDRSWKSFWESASSCRLNRARRMLRKTRKLDLENERTVRLAMQIMTDQG